MLAVKKLGSRQQQIWVSMKILHPFQLKKLKSWETYWRYKLNSFASQAHLLYFLSRWDGEHQGVYWRLRFFSIYSCFHLFLTFYFGWNWFCTGSLLWDLTEFQYPMVPRPYLRIENRNKHFFSISYKNIL